MITTRGLKVEPPKGASLKQRQVTTKTVDASIRVEPPKEPIKRRGISTTSLPDVADIVEKKRRDDIMAEVEAEKAKVKPREKKSLKEIAFEEKKAAMAARMAKVRAAKKKTTKKNGTKP